MSTCLAFCLASMSRGGGDSLAQASPWEERVMQILLLRLFTSRLMNFTRESEGNFMVLDEFPGDITTCQLVSTPQHS